MKNRIETINSEHPPDVWSAGGVVLKEEDGVKKVLLCSRTYENLIALPKGKPDFNETEEMAALREVREETGIEPTIISKVKEIFYHFSNYQEENTYKKVIFFLMEAVGGNILNHDLEFDKVYWEKTEVALKELTYQGERDVLEEAIELAKSSK